MTATTGATCSFIRGVLIPCLLAISRWSIQSIGGIRTLRYPHRANQEVGRRAWRDIHRSNYPPVYHWTTSSNTNGSALVVFEANLTDSPRLANNTLVAAIEVRAETAKTGFALWIDAGDGTWQRSNSGAAKVGTPKVVSYQTSTGASGLVRVALGLFAVPEKKGEVLEGATLLSVDLLGPIVVSVVGAPYSNFH